MVLDGGPRGAQAVMKPFTAAENIKSFIGGNIKISAVHLR
jgi:hypothetical protein